MTFLRYGMAMAITHSLCSFSLAEASSHVSPSGIDLANKLFRPESLLRQRKSTHESPRTILRITPPLFSWAGLPCFQTGLKTPGVASKSSSLTAG